MRLLAGIAGAAIVVYLLVAFVRNQSVDAYALNTELVTISTVRSGPFLDFVSIRGSVTPASTVYLDAIEGGRVEAILVEEGSFVAEGQPLLELSNTALQLDVISREAQVAEQLNNLRNTRLAIEQNRLSLRNQLIQLDYDIQRLERRIERRGQLADQGAITEEEYQDAIDQLEYLRNRREVTLESQAIDEEMRLVQIDSLESTVERLENNLRIAQDNLKNLNVPAPVSGLLTSLDAEIGESKGRGQRLGQIDDVENFKIVAAVDEYYVTRVLTGQTAELELGGQSYELLVDKIYPEVADGRFQIDLTFVGSTPPNLRRGQSLNMRLALGDATEGLLLPRGGFFQDTGGNWAFVLDESGAFADRRAIEIGQRNPEYLEILNGLEAGDRVITSAYTGFTDMNRIRLAD